MWTEANDQKLVDKVRRDMARFAAFRALVNECYCGLGPACPLWRDFSPAQRAACSQDKRAVAQARWMNGM
jgi:hypothetical protein